MKTTMYRNILIVFLFAMAMGFLEAIVVVYIRELYYPEGFDFPLKLIPENIFAIELVRELSTLIMLVSIGLLAGKTRLDKFAWFLFTFGVWDIFYYVALKIFLDWPESLLTWDILFLIPLTWIGPVLAPVLVSLTMIGFALAVFFPNCPDVMVKPLSWLAIFGGALLIFASFILDYTMLLIQEGGKRILDPGFVEAVTTYIPDRFYWGLFILGEVLIIVGIGMYIWKKKKRISS